MGNCPKGQLFAGGIVHRGNCLKGQFSQGQLSAGAIVLHSSAIIVLKLDWLQIWLVFSYTVKDYTVRLMVGCRINFGYSPNVFIDSNKFFFFDDEHDSLTFQAPPGWLGGECV